MRSPLSLRPTRISLLLTPARTRKRQEELAQRRLGPRRRSVLGISRAPLPHQRPRVNSAAAVREGGEACRATHQIPKEATGEFAYIAEAEIAHV